MEKETFALFDVSELSVKDRTEFIGEGQILDGFV